MVAILLLLSFLTHLDTAITPERLKSQDVQLITVDCSSPFLLPQWHQRVLSLLVFACQAGYTIAVLLRWSLCCFVLSFLVTIPWSVRAQHPCEEERAVIGLSLEYLSDQGLAVSSIEPLGFASRIGLQIGDVIEQANNQLAHDCQSYRQAVVEAKKDKKALLLLINSKGKKRVVVFERTVWEEPEQKAEQAVASLKTLLERPLPPPIQGQVRPLGEGLVVVLRELESTVAEPRTLSLPGSLSRYEQKLRQTEEQIVTLQRSVQGEAEKRVMAGVQVILNHYLTAQEIWQYKTERLEQTRPDLRRGEQAIYNAALPYFFDSPVLTWIDQYPFLKASIVTAPREGWFGEQGGEWNPDAAIRLLWQEGREETDRLSNWLQGTARSD